MTGAPDTAYCATCGHGAECLCTSTPAYESPPTLEDIMAEIVKINERLDKQGKNIRELYLHDPNPVMR